MTYIFILIAVLFVALAIYSYNKMVKNKNQMLEAWSIIDVLLKKRYELIPTLVEMVKGYQKYEEKTLNELTKKRSIAMNAGNMPSKITTETELTNSLNRFFISVENYPDLKANINFLDLQNAMSDIETELERSRRYYNGSVKENNTFIEKFPYNLFAKLLGFKKGMFFSIKNNEKEAPNVSLK